MNYKDKLDKVYRVRRILTIWSIINALSLGLAIIIIVYFIPAMPNGYISGKTPILQYVTVRNNPLVFALMVITLFALFLLSLYIKRFIKRKYKNQLF
jgi:hypothetical protein